MKRSTLLLCVTTLLLAGVVPLFADQACKPVEGHFEAFVVPPGTGHCPPVDGTLCTAGRVWGGIQGNYQFIATGFFPSAAIGGFASLITFGGGTGAMSTATGQIHLRGDFSAAEGKTSGDYLGTLCTQ